MNDLFQTHERSSSQIHTKQIHRRKGSCGHNLRRRKQLADTYPRIPESGTLLDDPQKARKLRIKASLYKMMEEKLYRSPRSVLSKITRLEYYWPSMHNDAKELIQKCKACQIYSSVPRKPKQEMTSFMLAWPFSQWGIDIVGSLSTAPSGSHRLLHKMGRSEAVNINNWKIHGKVYMGTHSMQVRKASDNNLRQCEIIVEGMERRLGKAHQAWIDELPQVIWAHRTTPKSCNRETPISLVYGSEAVIPIEIYIETKRVQDFDPKENEKRRREDLDILEERREMASIKEAHYKKKAGRLL
ncbi:reverse transcriptase domain-containing protein [Tanacetum coccineum]